MHGHDEDARVPPPSPDQKDADVLYGRQLAMDSILQDECRGMMTTTGVAGSTGHGPRRRVLWVGASIAASILGVWTILWSTGALGPAIETAGGREAENVAEREVVEPLTGDPTERSSSAPASRARVGTPQNPTGRQDPPKKSKDDVAGVLPKPGVKLKKLAIPEPDAEGKVTIPASADPEDIKLIRSAVAMFEAEARLAKKIEAGLIEGIDKLLRFDEISAWAYEDKLKGMPKELEKLDGRKVLMTGFMLPLDEIENIREFLLVESLWSCCYGQPPDINGVVRVILTGKNRTDYMFEPIKLLGTFRIEPTMEDGFCVDIFQLEVEKVETIE